MLLAVEDSQRILLEPRAAFLGQVVPARSEMLDQGVAPRIASRGIAERVELQFDPFADAELAQ